MRKEMRRMDCIRLTTTGTDGDLHMCVCVRLDMATFE